MTTSEERLATLLELVEGLFAPEEHRSLRGSLFYDRQRRHDALSRSDAAAAASHVMWSHPPDGLDHHWQVRRIERMAVDLRELVPSSIDDDGWSDAHCSIELARGRVEIIASRENGEDTDSTLTAIHEHVEGAWRPRLEISMAWDRPASDLLALDARAALAVVGEHGWNVTGATTCRHHARDGDLVVEIPYERLADVMGKGAKA